MQIKVKVKICLRSILIKGQKCYDGNADAVADGQDDSRDDGQDDGDADADDADDEDQVRIKSRSASGIDLSQKCDDPQASADFFFNLERSPGRVSTTISTLKYLFLTQILEQFWPSLLSRIPS